MTGVNKQLLKDMVIVRDATPDDKAFIYATFLRGLYYGNPWFTAINKDSFMATYHKVIDNLLAKPSTKIKIACIKDDPEVILGYSISEPHTLHWMFVKQAWRRLGLAKQLLPDDIKIVTHLTTIGEKLKPKEWQFDPFKI